jgi:hypothetical protein
LYTSRDNGTSFHVKDVSYSGGDVGQPHVLAGRWGTGSGTPYDLYSEHAASLGSDYAASSSLASTFRLGNVGQGTTGAGVADALYGTITEVLTYFDPLPVAVIQAIFQTITLPYNLP